MLPKSIESLAEKLRVFPGVGKRSSLKLALDILQLEQNEHRELLGSIHEVKQKVCFCKECGFFAESERSFDLQGVDLGSGNHLCEICKDRTRTSNQICLVEKPTDVISVEKSNIYRGRYHVLKKLISPLDNVFPEDTTIFDLIENRISKILKEGNEKVELILFFKEGFASEATTAYLKESIDKTDFKDKVSITRLAQGLPLYFNPDTLDQATMAKALEDRRVVL